MRLNDTEAEMLITSGAAAGKDICLVTDGTYSADTLCGLARGVNGSILALLPGKIFLPEQCGGYYEENGCVYSKSAGNIMFADVRRTSEDEFCSFIKNRGVSLLLIPFAECAFMTEHGYRASYGNVGELRASGFDFSVAALLSAPGANDARLTGLFGGREAVLVGSTREKAYNAVEFPSERERADFLCSEIRKSALKSMSVLFPTRRQAEEFSRFAAGKGIKCPVFHGGIDDETKNGVLNTFAKGEINCLAATKHIIPSALFVRSDRVFYSGLPFGTAHANRCAFLSENEDMTVCFTEGDAAFSEKLSAGLADSLGADRKTFLEIRKRKQDELMRRLTL